MWRKEIGTERTEHAVKLGSMIAKLFHWLHIRMSFGPRCETHDMDDFPDLEAIKHRGCHTCICGRCVICAEWDEFDEVWS